MVVIGDEDKETVKWVDLLQRTQYIQITYFPIPPSSFHHSTDQMLDHHVHNIAMLRLAVVVVAVL